MVNDADAVTKLGSFFHVVSGEQQSEAVLIQFEHRVQDTAAALRVNAHSGLIHI